MDAGGFNRTGLFMNLVLSIDAIQPPLAGIGRYAWELATRLPKHAEIESIRFTSDGFWRKLPRLQLEAHGSEKYREAPLKNVEMQQSLKTRLRQRFGRIPLLAMAHAKFMPLATSFQLNALPRGTSSTK